MEELFDLEIEMAEWIELAEEKQLEADLAAYENYMENTEC